MARLAHENRMEQVTNLSTVSGGSLITGLVFSLGGNAWPGSQEFLKYVLPQARQMLTTYDLQTSLIERLLGNLTSLLESRADDLSELIQEDWGVTTSLDQLPEAPRWMINTTCYETGKNWRFERFRMGDYLFGYSYDTDKVKVADAMAASAGFPGPIGPLPLETGAMKWFKYTRSFEPGADFQSVSAIRKRKTQPVKPLFPKVHLWDGGVYDNHGLEGLHDFITGWSDKVEFLVVSDAAGRGKVEEYKPGIPALSRMLTGIMMNQVRSLRSRAIIERIVNHQDKGVLLQTGNTCAEVLRSAGKPELIDQFCPGALGQKEADFCADFPTVIRKLKDEEFDTLYQHGFEVADVTLCAYYPQEFKHIAFPGK
jgi:NTE family protein